MFEIRMVVSAFAGEVRRLMELIPASAAQKIAPHVPEDAQDEDVIVFMLTTAETHDLATAMEIMDAMEES